MAHPIETREPASGASAGIGGWVRFVRVHQWSKNGILLIPLLTTHAYSDAGAVATCLAGIIALSLVASGTYVMNDLVDVEADRLHPSKRLRLLAAGLVSPEAATLAAAGLACAGFALASLIGPVFMACLMGYCLASLLYSFRLKLVPLLDVVFLGLLYTARIGLGALLVGAEQSQWLLSFSALFFTSLAFAKRHAEVHAAHLGGRTLAGRGYRPEDWPLTLACGIGSLSACVVLLILYLQEQTAVGSGLYHRPGFLWAVPVLTVCWSLRIWLLAHRGELRGDPVSFALRDTASLVLGAATLAAFVAATV
jgi:4-hydroxybenzoate polyprenyltransferase